MQNGQGYKVQYYRRQFPHSFVVSVLLWPGWDFARLSGCAFPSPCHGLSLQHSPCQLTVGILLAFQAAHSHPPATGCLCNIARANLRLGLCSPFRLCIPIPLPRAILQHCRNTHNKLCFLFLFRQLTRASF